MARKSELLPRYSESVVERGFDNVEMVERLRYSGGGRAILWSSRQIWNVGEWVFISSSRCWVREMKAVDA